VAESDDMGPGAPTVASEWTVEARGGGTCVVRVVHSLFASGEDWDDQLEGIEAGWPDFFRMLRIYLTDFKGLMCRQVQVTGFSTEPVAAAWRALTRALGLEGVAKLQQVQVGGTAPTVSGVVEEVMDEDCGRQIHLRLDRPVPGLAHVFALAMGGGQVCLSLRLYLYGPGAAPVADRDQPIWEAWMAERFPAPAPSDASA
jgi:hypothetical protein